MVPPYPFPLRKVLSPTDWDVVRGCTHGAG
jgi:hypothetical protein